VVVKLYWFIVIYWVYHLLGYGNNTFDCCDKMGTIMTLFPDCFQKNSAAKETQKLKKNL